MEMELNIAYGSVGTNETRGDVGNGYIQWWQNSTTSRNDIWLYTTSYTLAVLDITLQGQVSSNLTPSWTTTAPSASGTYTKILDTLTTSKFTVLTGGNVGIGTVSPGAPLDVYKSTYSIFTANSDSTGVYPKIAIGTGGGFDRTGYLNIYTTENSALTGMSSNHAMTITNYSGYGYSNGDAPSSICFRQRWWSGGGGLEAVGGIRGIKTSADGNTGGGVQLLYFNSTLQPGLTLNNSGYVGIGTTTPQAQFNILNTTSGGSAVTLMNVQYGTNQDSFQVAYDIPTGSGGGGVRMMNIYGQTGAELASIKICSTTSTTGSLIFLTNNGSGVTERMKITPAGNVGIGTTGPNQKLHVYGSMQLDRAASAYTITGATTTYAAGTWYTLVPFGALTQSGATYLVSMIWQSNPGANPWTLSTSFIWYNQISNDPYTSQLSGAAVPMSYHATNNSGDYQLSIRAQSNYTTYPAIQWKCNTALSNNGYWTAYCHIISY